MFSRIRKDHVRIRNSEARRAESSLFLPRALQEQNQPPFHSASQRTGSFSWWQTWNYQQKQIFQCLLSLPSRPGLFTLSHGHGMNYRPRFSKPQSSRRLISQPQGTLLISKFSSQLQGNIYLFEIFIVSVGLVHWTGSTKYRCNENFCKIFSLSWFSKTGFWLHKGNAFRAHSYS